MNTANLKKYLSLLLISALSFVQIVEAATVTLATAPIANLTTSVVHPNVMFVLDNSGSMAWNYLPDYVSSGSGGTGSQICWSGISDSNTLATCSNVSSTGSDVTVPFATSDINFLYYNPAIRYSAPVKADKTSYPNSTVTAAYTDGFAASGSTALKPTSTTGTVVASLAGSATTNNSTLVTVSSSAGLLGTFVYGTGIPANAYVAAVPDATHITLSAKATATGSTTLTFRSGAYSHQVFCNSSLPGSPTVQDLRNPAYCMETSNTSGGQLYPLSSTTASSNFVTPKTYNGPAFYYTMSPKGYCTNSLYSDCTAAADGTHTVPMLYRWCSSYTPAVAPATPGIYNGCQDIRDQTHTIPDYLGSYIPGTAGVAASADLTVQNVTPEIGWNITALNVNGTNIIAAGSLPISVVGGDTPHTLAVKICSAIQANSAFSGYNCPTTGSTYTTLKLVANNVGIAPNGFSVNVVSSGGNTVYGVKATGSFSITSTNGATVVNDITVGGTSVMTTKPWYFIDGTQTTTIATKLASLIGNGYTATSSGAVITITKTSFGPDAGNIVLSATAVPAKASITSTAAVPASGGSIGAITVLKNATFGGGTTTLEALQGFAASATTTAVASQLTTSLLGASGFTATSATNVATFTAPALAPNQYNGQTINIAAGTPQSASGTMTITATGATRVDDITVFNGTANVSVLSSKPYYFGDLDTSVSICSGLASKITLLSFTASCGGTNILTITAPSGTTIYNGGAITMTGSAVSAKAIIKSLAAVSATQPGTIAAITAGLGGTTIEAAQSFAAGSTTTQVASQIAAGPLLNSFTATSATDTVTVTAPAGKTYNGKTIDIQVGTLVPAAAAATGSVTLVSTSGATNIQQITANGTNLLSAPLNFADGTATSANATTLCAAIEAFKATSGYGCPSTSGAQVNIKATTNTSAKNGTIAVTTNSSAGSSPTASIGFTAVTVNSPGNVTITAGSNNTCSAGPAVTLFNGSLTTDSTTCAGGSANLKRANRFTDLIFSNVAGSATAAAGWADASAACSGTVTYSAPLGTANNNWFLCRTLTTPANFTTTVASPSATQFAGGTAAVIAQATTNVAMAGGTAGVYSYSSNLSVGTFTAAASGGSATPTVVASPAANAGYVAASGSGSMNSSGVGSNYGSLSAGTFPTAANGATGSSTATANAGYAPQNASANVMGGGGGGTNGVSSNGRIPIDVTDNPVGATAYDGTGALAGGVDTISSSRTGLGIFTRVNIVPSTTSYTKASGRTDCAASTCTYDEELQNFANWYSYYRIRLMMMKSASTIAFDQLNSKFRVGFDLLSHYGSGAVDLQVAQFVDTGGETANQRSTWWNNLTNATTSGSTPLRSEVNKIGRYFAGKLTSGSATPAVPETKAKGNIGISSANNGAIVNSIMVEGVEILGTPITAACSATCTSAQRNTFATAIKNAINTYVVAHPAIPQYVASCTGGASCSSSTITLTAPPVTTATDPSAPTADGQGTYFNGNVVSFTKTGTITLTKTDMGGGVDSAPAIPATAFEPIQYSCQQNYALLVTDGYWNSNLYTDQKQMKSPFDPIGNQDNVLYDVNTAPNGVIRGQYDGEQTSTTCTDSAPSSCGTLADIAMYYYKTDLRDASLSNNINSVTGEDVATNNVFVTPGDQNNKQHMVFFGMGLGAPGTLRYEPDYLTATTGDYHDIVVGNVVSGSTVYKNWPAVEVNNPTTIDDLWHATVNGHGKYFSARDPVSASAGLKDALFSITARVGSAAAAATSNLKPVSGDNFAYVASYETVSWVGDVQARTINLVTGAVDDGLDANNNSTCGLPLDASGQGCPWSAQTLLDAKAFGSRSIYIAPGTGVSLDPMRLFDYSNLSAGEKAYFDPSTLNQYASAHASYPSDVTAANLVNFLRGDRSLEANGVSGQKQIWRKRDHVLGDIVSTQPAFVKKPTFTYLDAGYSAFKNDTAISARPGMVYISANDGMMHAIDAATGQERWSFIPKEALPGMKVLADSDYQHRYFVDGQISVGDVNFGHSVNDWHTILVAGLGSGGKEYFALDITDPTAPVFLWEITSSTTGFANLGYSFGNASINKLPNGEWAVFFSSGYNNADGHGYLYAVNPETGALKTGFPMGTASASPTGDGGTAASPSNLGKMSAWVTDVQANNTAEFFYGGDMNGNVWRFDLALSTTGHTNTPVFKLAQLKNAAGIIQPITTKLELTEVGTTHVIYAATGQYLSIDDPTNTDVQSVYAIKDTLGVPNLGGTTQDTWHPRDDVKLSTMTGNPLPNGTPLFLSRTIVNTTDVHGNPVRTICDTDALVGGVCGTGAIMDFGVYGGWYADFPDTGERANVDMNLTLGTLVLPTNVPNSNACNSGGYSWINYLDFKTGLAVSAENASNDQPIMGQKVEGALTVGINVVQLPGGSLAAIVTTSDYRNVTVNPAFNLEVFTGHRDLWRELQVY